MKQALIKLHIAVFLWGFTGVLGRSISLNEGWLVWWRMLLTVVTMWILFGSTGKIKKVSLKEFLTIGGIGVLLAMHWLCFYGSIKYANVSIALICLSGSGFVSAILEPLFFGRRINIKELFFGLLTIVGIFMIYQTNLHFSTGFYIGILACLLTVTVSILNKKIVDRYQPESFTLYQLTGGFIGLSALMLFYNHAFPAITWIPAKMEWVWLIVLAWLCTIFTFILYTQSLKKLSAFTMNLTLTLEPVYGIVLAFVIYHENKDLSNTFYIGFLFILFAVFLQTMSLAKKRPATATAPLPKWWQFKLKQQK
ncbi:DMT family transporter [Arachidicoccus terrestris]|uniref:DMT family transporter n=1 Tax=Arachidicoccus terrestris TaxID=2875539 RepID=UPI001CC4DD87|nr:DMT family transporter [Arachidicoccus terrestris]UAY54316.1 DMT family transporter [Arachidicoccus terrestris]